MSNINWNSKVIFIHIAKCAGCSLGTFKWNKGSGHQTYADFESELVNKKGKLSSEELSEFFTWCFVRNPWDRAVSAYEDCPELQPTISSFGDFVDALYKNRGYIKSLSYLRWTSLALSGLPVGRIHFMPMHLCMRDKKGRFMPSFVGRFENLEDDFKHLQKLLKRDGDSDVLPHCNARKNKKNRRNSFYKDLYTDSLVNQVGEIYKEDIELFSYKPPL